MRVLQELLIPCVKYSEEAEPGAQMARVGSNAKQRFRNSSEQNAVNDSPVLKCQIRQLAGKP